MPTRPMVQGIHVELGDVVAGPGAGFIDAGRVKGWSEDGNWLYVGWLGVVAVEQVQWVEDLAVARFPLLYRPATKNQWTSQSINSKNDL